MNCPQCQERLDEQLDELRPGLRSGTLSPDDARTQAQKALAETVSQCAECEAELRAHLNLRLSLMLPYEEMASVAVPPALRANVRRALERESAQRPYAAARPTWNPLKSFVWTGGAVLSAIALFVIARPFLYEKATAPLPDAAVSVSSGPADSAAPGSGTGAGSAAPPVVKQSVPAKPSTSPRLTPSPKKAVPPPTALGRAGTQTPNGALTPPALPTPRMAPAQPVEPPRSASSGAPSPKIAAPPASISQSPSRPSSGAREKAGQRSKTSAPSGPDTPATLSKPQPQIMRSVGPTLKPPALPDSGASAPREPRLESSLLAPRGKGLGLTVRFVPAAPRADSEKNSTARSMYVAPPPVPAPSQDSAPPSAVAPSTAKVAPQPERPAQPVAPGIAQRGGMGIRQRTAPKTAAPQPEAMTGAASNAADAALHDSDSNQQNTLAVSVNEAVTNARVVGQVQGREGKGILLWSGNAPARKPISVPLEPLNANKGDTINISFQQQVSLGETKILATTSIVVP